MKLTYRKDYTVSNYLIKTTDLVFKLFEDKTIVTNTMYFYKNPKSTDNSNKLFLNGKNLKLINLKKNNIKISCKTTDRGIFISDLDDEFSLEVITEIYPSKNTSLKGLYKSSGNFCTQCEAQGFRNISYYLDRPDVLSIWSVVIIADKSKYPMLLSNGNLILEDKNSVKWHDPHPKPCYLFALVAGDFAVLTDVFITKSNKKVQLKIFTQKHNFHKTNFAMLALKKAFLWDETRFNLEYDLDIYMIVAVDDFNMGAMENKGLNIFNSIYVLADTRTATDKDFINIEALIGHEYFHNWTGNRVTCRDWFQLSLKEGLTVFREQEFTSDEHSRALKRIDDAQFLRSLQFAEDSGAMAHPVRPDSYLEVDNFYTLTVYEKGAEIVRMLHTLLGEKLFQKAINLYLTKHNATAATVDDFIMAMESVSAINLAQFKLWYSQIGTPVVDITTDYDSKNKTFIINIKQKLTNNNSNFYIPFNYALFNNDGKKITTDTVIIDTKTKQLKFNDISSKPVCSYLRGFSAPIIVNTNLSYQERIKLLSYEDDAFSKFNNAQILWGKLLLNKLGAKAKKEIFNCFFDILATSKDNGLTARLISMPNEKYIQQQKKIITVVKTHNDLLSLALEFANFSKDLLLSTYNKLNNNNNEFNETQIANRALKNTCLWYLSLLKKYDLCYKQYQSATCMSDKFSAFIVLTRRDNHYRNKVLSDFYNTYKDDTQVIDKWFSTQALAEDADIKVIKRLMKHEQFVFLNPNKLRAVIGSWCSNYMQFHSKDGYELLSDIIIKLNTVNSQVGARFVAVFSHYRRYQKPQSNLQKQALEKILAVHKLSPDIQEVVTKTLNNK